MDNIDTKIEELIKKLATSKPRFIDVKHIPQYYPAFNISAAKDLMRNRNKTGFDYCVAKLKPGKASKIIIDTVRFDEWLEKKFKKEVEEDEK